MSSIDVKLVLTLENLLQSNIPRLESSNPIKPASKQEPNPLELLRQKALVEMKSSIGQVIISDQANSYKLTQLSLSEKYLNDFKEIVNKHETNPDYFSEAVEKLLEFSKSYTNFQKQFTKENLFSGSETDKQNLWDIPSPRKLSFEDNPKYENQLNSIQDLHERICEQHSNTTTSKFSYALDRVFEALTQEKFKEITAEYEAPVQGFSEAEIKLALMKDYLETKTKSSSDLETFNKLLTQEIRNIHLDDQYYALTKRVKVLEHKQNILEAYKSESSPERSFTEALSSEALKKFQEDLEKYIQDNPLPKSRYSKALNILNTAPVNSLTQNLEESIKQELHLTRLGRLSAVITADQDFRPSGFVQGLYFPERVDHEDRPFVNIKTFDPKIFYFPDGINPADEYLRIYEESLKGKMGDYSEYPSSHPKNQGGNIQTVEKDRKITAPEDVFVKKGFINEVRVALASKLLLDNSKQEYSVVKILDASFSGILDASKIDTILLVRQQDEYRAILLQCKSSELGMKMNRSASLSMLANIIPTNKSLEEIGLNITKIIQDALEKQSGIKLSLSQMQVIEKLPSTLDVFSELELIKIITKSPESNLTNSHEQDLHEKLSKHKVNTLQYGLNILTKIPENDLERESLLLKFLEREQIPLSENQSHGLFFQALATDVKKADLSISFMRLATYRVAKAVKSNPDLTDQDLKDLIKASVSSAKEESILLEENTSKYITAISKILEKPYISEFKSAVNKYLEENKLLPREAVGKLSEAKISQLQDSLQDEKFSNKVTSLLMQQSISYNQLQEILPKLIHRTFTRDLPNGKANLETVQNKLLVYLESELRGTTKEIVFKDTCIGAVNNLLRQRVINTDDIISVPILPAEQINLALTGFYKQDQSVIHNIIKAFKPEQQREFQMRLGGLLMEHLKQDIYDQCLGEFDKSLTSESVTQSKKTFKDSKQDHSLSLRQQSEENLEQNYKNLALVVLDFLGNSFGEDMRNFYYSNYDKKDHSGVRNHDKMDDSRVRNYNKIDRLLLSHSRIQSSPQELMKRLNKDLNTWKLKIDQERLENLVKESINEVMGTMFGVNNG
jgi:hypothetical protein